MYTWIILIVVVGIISYLYSRYDGETISDSLLISTFSGLIVGTLMMTLVSIFLATYIPDEDYVEYVDTEYLANFQDNTSLSGEFFLGIGSINGSMMYCYYGKTDDGGYKLKSVSCKSYTVYEGDSPRIERCTYEIDKNSSWYNWTWFKDVNGPRNKNKVIVPNGTIQQNFVLDAK